MSMAERLFSDAFKQDMAFILEKAAAANRALSACALTGELSDQLGLLSSEIAVVALVAADELDGQRGTETVLMRGEIALRLRQIATHCLDAQETEAATGYFNAMKLIANALFDEISPMDEQVKADMVSRLLAFFNQVELEIVAEYSKFRIFFRSKL